MSEVPVGLAYRPPTQAVRPRESYMSQNNQPQQGSPSTGSDECLHVADDFDPYDEDPEEDEVDSSLAAPPEERLAI